MSQPVKHFYEFDDFRIDRGERLLWRKGEMLALTQKAFDLLIVLVECRARVVEKEELIRQVWQGTFIEEGTLTQNIYTLRKVLGKTPDGSDYIQTLPRRGYRFTAQVNEISVEGSTTTIANVSAIKNPESFGDPAGSPDGKVIACVYAENYTAPGKLAIFPFEGGQPVKVFQSPVQLAALRWTPDGRALAYAENLLNASKIWVLSVEGGEPKPLIEFEAELRLEQIANEVTEKSR